MDNEAGPVDDILDEALNLTGCRVLVIDDSDRNHRIFETYLGALEIDQVEFAFNGAEGLEKVDSFSPDLVILDLMMPVMDGHEFLRRLRARPEYLELPIIVATAMESEDKRTMVFREGATDFVTKPINAVELLARTSVHLRNRLLIAEQRQFRQRVGQELSLASSTQLSLLPDNETLKSIQSNFKINLDYHFEPSTELGGDLWGMRPIDDQRLAIYMADFSGHGVSAALNTMRLHTLVNQMDETIAADCGDVLARLNEALVGLLPRGQYATMIYGVLNSSKRTFSYASAAAPDLLIGADGEDSVKRLVWNSLPLGIDAGSAYEVREVTLPEGGFLFFHSDALSEMPNSTGHILEEKGVTELVQRCFTNIGHEPPLRSLIRLFRGGTPEPLGDDLTLVWVRLAEGQYYSFLPDS